MSRRLVVRLDILPHLEMVSVQRVGAFGVVYSKLYRIQDLEYVPYEAIKDNGKTTLYYAFLILILAHPT